MRDETTQYWTEWRRQVDTADTRFKLVNALSGLKTRQTLYLPVTGFSSQACPESLETGTDPETLVRQVIWWVNFVVNGTGDGRTFQGGGGALRGEPKDAAAAAAAVAAAEEDQADKAAAGTVAAKAKAAKAKAAKAKAAEAKAAKCQGGEGQG